MNNLDQIAERMRQIAAELEASLQQCTHPTDRTALQLSAHVLRGFLRADLGTQSRINLLGIGISQGQAARISDDVTFSETNQRLTAHLNCN